MCVGREPQEIVKLPSTSPAVAAWNGREQMNDPAPQPLRVFIDGGTASERAFLRAQIAAMPAKPEVLESDRIECVPAGEGNPFNRLLQSNPVGTVLLRWDDLTVIDANPALAELLTLTIGATPDPMTVNEPLTLPAFVPVHA